MADFITTGQMLWPWVNIYFNFSSGMLYRTSSHICGRWYLPSDTLLWIYKSLNLNIFSDLRKPGLVPGKSLSLRTKISSVLEKYLSYIMAL